MIKSRGPWRCVHRRIRALRTACCDERSVLMASIRARWPRSFPQVPSVPSSPLRARRRSVFVRPTGVSSALPFWVLKSHDTTETSRKMRLRGSSAKSRDAGLRPFLSTATTAPPCRSVTELSKLILIIVVKLPHCQSNSTPFGHDLTHVVGSNLRESTFMLRNGSGPRPAVRARAERSWARPCSFEPPPRR